MTAERGRDKKGVEEWSDVVEESRIWEGKR